MSKRFELIGPSESRPEIQYGNAGFGFTKRLLRHGKSRGVEIVTLRCGSLSVTVIPSRGMGIANVLMGDLRIGWQSPVRGPVHPGWVPLQEPSGLGWLDGFDELLARCGLVSNGAPQFDSANQLVHGLHGRIANLPAEHVEIEFDEDAETMQLTGIVEESRFHFHRLRMTSTLQMDASQPTITIIDTVSNQGAQATPMQMLYHWNFGPPLLQQGAKVHAAVQRIAPRNPVAQAAIDSWSRYAAPQTGFAEQVYFAQLHSDALDQTTVMLTNADESLGIALEYNVRQLPCFSLWKNTVAEADGYVTGLEPGINFPNPTSFEQQHGRTVILPQQGAHQMKTRLTVCGPERVSDLKKHIAGLQLKPAIIEPEPPAEWVDR